MYFIFGGVVGFVAGAFTPSVGKKIKAYFVSESKSVETKAASAVSTEAKKI